MNTSFISDEARETQLLADINRLLNPQPVNTAYDLDTPERFVLSWYGSVKGLGGKPADLERIVNVLHNHLDFEGHVNVVHKDFGYIVISEGRLRDAIRILSIQQAPKGQSHEDAVSYADLFVALIPRENFLLGHNDLDIEYSQFVTENGVNRTATVSI